MKKIAIFQANLKVGGIQRSLVNLLNSGIFNGYEVDVYLFSEEIFYNINDFSNNIHIKYLSPFPYWYRFVSFELIKKFHKCTIDLNEYEFAIDYDSYRQECAYYVTSAKNANKIMWIHSDMELEYKHNFKYRILYQFFKKKYRYYDQFVAVSHGVVEAFRKKSGQYASKITVVPNIINVEEILQKSRTVSDVVIDQDKINIVCVGRLYLAKGYEFLLSDFQNAHRIKPNLCLYIIGEGPDRKKYERWVKKNNLEEAVFFLGKRENPFSIMKEMDAFCLESRYEGQGMVFMEAKVLGLPLVFPKRLEKYNIGITGTDDVVKSMLELKKAKKIQDNLEDYHSFLFSQLKSVLATKN